MSLTRNSKKNIVFVSISSDLYGSSKLLLTLVSKLHKETSYHPIVCMPLENGPFKDELRRQGIEMIEMPVLKLTRSMLKSLKIGAFIKEYKEAKRIFENHIGDRKLYAIQSNTLATLFGSIYCFRRKIKHIMHIHEIVDRPKAVRYFFVFMLWAFAHKIIYNSNATAKFYNNILKRLRSKSVLIYNGVDRLRTSLTEEQIKTGRQEFFGDQDIFIIGLVGRINRLKGHNTTLDAFSEVIKSNPQARLLFTGSPPDGQEHFLTDLQERIESMQLDHLVKIVPFQSDIYSVIDLLDILLVPSTEPESFGIVAVEGMLSKKAVIASNIGGLADVIEDEESGLLSIPGDPTSLKHQILRLIEDKDLRNKLEENGYARARSLFSSDKMLNEFEKFYTDLRPAHESAIL